MGKIFRFVGENKIKEILLLDDMYKKNLSFDWNKMSRKTVKNLSWERERLEIWERAVEKMSTELPKKCGKQERKLRVKFKKEFESDLWPWGWG